MIPYGHQSIDDDDIAAVVEALRSDWLTQGPKVAEFETDFAAAVGARHAVAFSSGTAALHGACAAARLGPGMRVITSPLSFAASANCARYVGADVDFVDIDPATLNLDLTQIPECDALVAVYYAGLPLDLARLPTRPRVVIEDAAHALGAITSDGPVGNCARSDLCCFSFHPVKAITTGEGGAVTTNDDELAERLRAFRHHGIRPTPERGGWAYDVEEIGFNYRLTDLQAALGSSQLRKLPAFVDRRNALAAQYRDRLADLPINLPPAAPTGSRHAYHLFPVRVPDRRRVFDGMREAGVGVQVHYEPIYRLAAYGGDPARFPQTEAETARLLSLPMHAGLTDADQNTVVETLAKLVG